MKGAQPPRPRFHRACSLPSSAAGRPSLARCVIYFRKRKRVSALLDRCRAEQFSAAGFLFLRSCSLGASDSVVCFSTDAVKRMLFTRRAVSLSCRGGFAPGLPTSAAASAALTSPQFDFLRSSCETKRKAGRCGASGRSKTFVQWTLAVGVATSAAFLTRGDRGPGRCSSSGLRRVRLGDLSDFPEGGVYEVSLDAGGQCLPPAALAGLKLRARLYFHGLASAACAPRTKQSPRG